MEFEGKSRQSISFQAFQPWTSNQPIFQVLRALLQFGCKSGISVMSRIIWISPNCSCALNTWKLAGSRFKVESLKRDGLYTFPLQFKYWRLFNQYTSPSVFCILCKSLFREMVPSSCLMGHQQCSLNNVNGFVEVHHVIFSYWILLTY